MVGEKALIGYTRMASIASGWHRRRVMSSASSPFISHISHQSSAISSAMLSVICLWSHRSCHQPPGNHQATLTATPANHLTSGLTMPYSSTASPLTTITSLPPPPSPCVPSTSLPPLPSTLLLAPTSLSPPSLLPYPPSPSPHLPAPTSLPPPPCPNLPPPTCLPTSRPGTTSSQPTNQSRQPPPSTLCSGRISQSSKSLRGCPPKARPR